MAFEGDEGDNLLAERAELVGAAEFGEIDHERTPDNPSTGAFQELDGGKAGAAGRDQIVDDEYVVAMLQRVGVDFDAVGSVFKCVILAQHLPGQLALLAHRNESDRKLMCDRAAQNEAARLDSGHLVDPYTGIGLYELVDRAPERAGMSEQRRDVAEDDSGLRIIRNGTDDGSKVHFAPLRLKPLTRAGTNPAHPPPQG